MCQGCRDFAEFEAAIDEYLAVELPKMIAQPLDDAVLYGSHH